MVVAAAEVEALAVEVEITVGGLTTEESGGGALPFPTSQVCSGVKLGGEHGVLLRKPSLLRVRHWFPGPTPLLTASRIRGKPIPAETLLEVLKKYCWSKLVSPSPAARPPIFQR